MQPLNYYIDHTLLKPEALQEDFETLLDEAIEHQFTAVCVSPYMAIPVRNTLNATGYPFIKTCTVVDFPLGNKPLELKMQEAQFLSSRGVDEVDFVLNHAELRNKNFKYIIQELQNMSDICKQNGSISKCIVETCYLSKEEKDAVFHFIKDYATNVDFIKTSTSFGPAGAQLEDVARWNELRGNAPRPLIKAAGGIKTLDDALAFIEAGADRLGMSTGVKVMEELHARNAEASAGREEETREVSEDSK
ncbi:MAG: deoxyribose-phosphate aldolase [Candidatus Altiarchaeales archaeon]|nr:deoxyribose-phosphate aldolase [Candidatus Altiarchaeales archaeon]